MKTRLLGFLLAAASALPLVGCGEEVIYSARKPLQQYRVSPVGSGTGSPAAPADPNDLSKNPFVIWVKKAYPREASTIITRYLAQDGKVDPDRDVLRRQALDQTATELNKQVSISLPPGITSKKVGTSVAVSGVTTYEGQKIAVRFEFRVSLLPSGFIKIDVPPSTVYAGSANNSVLVEWFGGNVKAKAHAEIIKSLDKEGPPNVARTPGLSYQKGGVFLVDPGLAFVNMPA